ncbi:MAG: sodium-translocating pyrophosphatase [Planctomyces sp.]|nr:sodium-translocating pyrophosphatase [Planctomyces sp.]
MRFFSLATRSSRRSQNGLLSSTDPESPKSCPLADSFSVFFRGKLIRCSPFLATLWLLIVPTPLLAAEGDTSVNQIAVAVCWLCSFGGSIAALIFAIHFFLWMKKQNEGDEKMIEIANHVREGARAYLKRQYTVVAAFIVFAILVLTFLSFGLKTQSGWIPFAFFLGALGSGIAGWFGMKTATEASSRTTQAAKDSLNAALQVAFRSGAVMGLTVVGMALLSISLLFALLYWVWQVSLEDVTLAILGISMGASSQALFARVGGGIFTKAADVGADLVGKVEAGIPEDDPRNPATIADNVGDNVGDVAGMGADLYESYCGCILASAALGVAAYQGDVTMQAMLMLLPMVLAAAGIGLSIWGVFLVKADEGASQHALMKSLEKGSTMASIGVGFAALLLVILMLVLPSDSENSLGLPGGWQMLGVCWAILTGLIAGVLIGRWTEYSTSAEYGPTQRIADQSRTGPATIIIAGVAEGFYSVWVPIVIVCVAIMLAFGFCTGFDFDNPKLVTLGLYGVSIAAVGMLSTLGITLATDAYGPIADNAGGNAEMSNQEPYVRERTDALDSLGNTTAAIGKGFAIGSAALTALALLAAYIEQVRIGIDQWVTTTEREVVQSVSLAEANATKIGAGIAAVRTAEAGPADAYLFFPSGRMTENDGGLAAFHAAEDGKLVPVNLEQLINSDKVIPVREATMPDFVRFYNANLMNPKVLSGVFIGVLLTFVFCALTMKAVGRSASDMVEEVRRQFREIKGIMEREAEPDYAACVAISTAAAQREMVVPALLGLIVPVLVGVTLGVGGVMGMLVGGLTSGFAVAIMMANSGGAWDNAKKYIEAGAHGGKGSDAHKAAVVGDTVGDPFKDTSGPSLNILIKLMSIVSVIAAGFVVQYSIPIF